MIKGQGARGYILLNCIHHPEYITVRQPSTAGQKLAACTYILYVYKVQLCLNVGLGSARRVRPAKALIFKRTKYLTRPKIERATRLHITRDILIEGARTMGLPVTRGGKPFLQKEGVDQKRGPRSHRLANVRRIQGVGSPRAGCRKHHLLATKKTEKNTHVFCQSPAIHSKSLQMSTLKKKI